MCFPLVLLALSTQSCSRASKEAPASSCAALRRSGPTIKRSIVFVLADTLRRDRLGSYGGPAETPAFDALAASNIRFDAAATQSPWTKPAIATLFTGLYPSQHGVVSHPTQRVRSASGAEEIIEADVLADAAHTLAEALASGGYQTAAVVSNPWLQSRFGFSQGFEEYQEDYSGSATPGSVVTRLGLRWLAERQDERPFFLYLHYMDAHSPYPPLPRRVLRAHREEINADSRPVTKAAQRIIEKFALAKNGKPLSEKGVKPTRLLAELVYDEGVVQFDRALGVLLAGIAKREDAEEIAIVVTSDHGEALYARGWGSHGSGLYQDEIAIPLVAKLPGVSAEGPVDCLVGLVDLRSTLCGYVGVDCGSQDLGTSLLGDPAEGRPGFLLSEGVMNKSQHRALRTRTHKLIYQPDGPGPWPVLPGHRSWSLYDLAQDPQELRDLLGEPDPSDETEAISRQLRAGLEGYDLSRRLRSETAPLDEATQKRLKALGYLDEKLGGTLD